MSVVAIHETVTVNLDVETRCFDILYGGAVPTSVAEIESLQSFIPTRPSSDAANAELAARVAERGSRIFWRLSPDERNFHEATIDPGETQPSVWERFKRDTALESEHLAAIQGYSRERIALDDDIRAQDARELAVAALWASVPRTPTGEADNEHLNPHPDNLHYGGNVAFVRYVGETQAEREQWENRHALAPERPWSAEATAQVIQAETQPKRTISARLGGLLSRVALWK